MWVGCYELIIAVSEKTAKCCYVTVAGYTNTQIHKYTNTQIYIYRSLGPPRPWLPVEALRATICPVAFFVHTSLPLHTCSSNKNSWGGTRENFHGALLSIGPNGKYPPRPRPGTWPIPWPDQTKYPPWPRPATWPATLVPKKTLQTYIQTSSTQST